MTRAMECKCGCGQKPPKNAVYVLGHNFREAINPSGISIDRALEIAVELAPRFGRDWGRTRSRPVYVPEVDATVREIRRGDHYRMNSGRGTGKQMSDDQRQLLRDLVSQGRGEREIAYVVGCSSRTVNRYREAARMGTTAGNEGTA